MKRWRPSRTTRIVLVTTACLVAGAVGFAVTAGPQQTQRTDLYYEYASLAHLPFAPVIPGRGYLWMGGGTVTAAGRTTRLEEFEFRRPRSAATIELYEWVRGGAQFPPHSTGTVTILGRRWLAWGNGTEVGRSLPGPLYVDVLGHRGVSPAAVRAFAATLHFAATDG